MDEPAIQDEPDFAPVTYRVDQRQGEAVDAFLLWGRLHVVFRFEDEGDETVGSYDYYEVHRLDPHVFGVWNGDVSNLTRWTLVRDGLEAPPTREDVETSCIDEYVAAMEQRMEGR